MDIPGRAWHIKIGMLVAIDSTAVRETQHLFTLVDILCRMMKSAALLDVLDQPFKSYANIATSGLRQLQNPAVFELLDSNHLLLSVGDYPKVMMTRKLILQVSQEQFLRSLFLLGIMVIQYLGTSCDVAFVLRKIRNLFHAQGDLQGPLPLAKLLHAGNPELFKQVLETHGLSDDDEGHTRLAKAYMNIVVVC
jgi:hypothetical protein